MYIHINIISSVTLRKGKSFKNNNNNNNNSNGNQETEPSIVNLITE